MVHRRNLDIDYDWKPEVGEDPGPKKKPGKPSTSGAKSGQSQQETTIPSLVTKRVQNIGPYRGVMMIVQYDMNPPMFEVILDDDKTLFRFPFGGLEPTDNNQAAAASRETREEIGLDVSLDGNDFLGEVSGSGLDCILYVFTKKVTTDLKDKVVLGKEQKWHCAMTASLIDEYANKGLVTKKHVLGWELFKRKRLNQN